MALTFTVSVNNGPVEAQIKAMLTALGFDVGTTDAAASAAWKALIVRDFRSLLLTQRREAITAAAVAGALSQLDTGSALIS